MLLKQADFLEQYSAVGGKVRFFDCLFLGGAPITDSDALIALPRFRQAAVFRDKLQQELIMILPSCSGGRVEDCILFRW